MRRTTPIPDDRFCRMTRVLQADSRLTGWRSRSCCAAPREANETSANVAHPSRTAASSSATVNARARTGITPTAAPDSVVPVACPPPFDELSVTPLDYPRGGDTRTSFDTLCRNRQLPRVWKLRVVKQPTRANTLLLGGGVGGTEP